MKNFKKFIIQTLIMLIVSIIICTILIPEKVEAMTASQPNYVYIIQRYADTGKTTKILLSGVHATKVTSKDTDVVIVSSYTWKSGTGTTVELKGKSAGSAILNVTRNSGSTINVVVAVARESAYEFLTYVQKYSDNIFKAYPKTSLIKYGSGSKLTKTQATAKSELANGNTIYVNCATPAEWALKQMGLIDKSNDFWLGKDGSVNGINLSKSSVSKVLKNKTSSDAIGKTVQTAAKKGYLLPGDIIGQSSTNHTFIYLGLDANNKPLVYESGNDIVSSASNMKSVGCGPFTATKYTDSASSPIKIKTVLRWIND